MPLSTSDFAGEGIRLQNMYGIRISGGENVRNCHACLPGSRALFAMRSVISVIEQHQYGPGYFASSRRHCGFRAIAHKWL
jgi:hypothetical protein